MNTFKTQNGQPVTLIDAGTLDEEQFNSLINNLDARHPLIPLLLAVLVIIAGAGVIV